MSERAGVGDVVGPELSVIVPCYNARETLGAQLEALSRQTWTGSWEVIVADNGSTDDTRAIAERFEQRLRCLRVVDASGTPGAAYARNLGTAHARGSHLAFVDADDVVADGWLAAIGGALREHVFVASRFEEHELNDAETLEIRSCPQQDGLLTFKYAPFLPFASASGMGMRREVFEKLGGFDISFGAGEDIDLCWRAQLEGVPLRFVPEAVVRYRLRSDLAGVLRQTENYGYWTVPIYRKYRKHGMTRVPKRAGLLAWLRLLLRTPYVVKRRARMRWLKDLAYRWGLLKGSLHFRTFVL